jgi:Uri superfamily endonuclease
MSLIELSLESAVRGLEKGTYVLILRLDAPCTLFIGGLGDQTLPTGWYAYVGSAQGPGGLAARLRHHLIGTARPHWHIDYLRRSAVPAAIWAFEGAARLEHEWARGLLSVPGARPAVARFGASDCRCQTHLVHFPEAPDATAFLEQVGQDMPQDPALRVFNASGQSHE